MGIERKIRRVVLAALTLLVGRVVSAPPTLEQAFADVPTQSRPWAYWWWLNGNVDKETITHDLEAMKRVGFGGLLMFDARGYWDDKNHVVLPPSKMEFMSDEWREMLAFGIREADRLGLEVSVNLSSCAGALKGPWAVGKDAPKRLVWQAIPLVGGTRFEQVLAKPADREFFWDIATMAVRYEGPVLKPTKGWEGAGAKLAKPPRTVVESVDLSGRADAEGRLTWDVPAGQWALLRFGYTTLDGHEYDVDILDAKAVEGHFDRMAKAIMADVGPLAGKTLTHFYSVSWEGAVPRWTNGFEQCFETCRGYAIRPWLPVLGGLTVKSGDESQRFLDHYRRTRNDVFRENFYGTMLRLCHGHGLKWHSESGGPWSRSPVVFEQADQLAFLARNDMPQGEFWYTGQVDRRGRQMSRPQAMTAHIYGKKLAAAEAFTHMTRHWTPYPALLKRSADESFVDGVNQLVWHTFTCSPKAFGLPGSEYFAGTHINPNVTWFEQAAPFLQYLGRCQHMLRQGLFVADACVFVGDTPYLHWGRGVTWSKRATLSLPKGYTYDLVNTEVLLDRMAVQDGALVLPDGMSYRMLVVDLDYEQVSLSALRRITELRQAGATVVFGTRRPTQATGNPEDDAEVRRLGGSLWPGTETMEQALARRAPLPDFDGPFEYIHRRDGEADIYFLSGTGTGTCTFRVTGKIPELWDPVSGIIRDANRWQLTQDGRTRLSLHLPEHGSMFLAFREPGTPQSPKPEPRVSEELALAGPWEVTFQPGRGALAKVVFDQLIGWDKHPDAGIRHFSGTAVYRKTLDLPADQTKSDAWLELGEVASLAEVCLNGKSLGIAWCAPWRVDLSGALVPGENRLEIHVTNAWANRMVGDASLPPEKRFTQSNMQFENGKRTLHGFQGFAAGDFLQPCGLRGPVKLKLYQM